MSDEEIFKEFLPKLTLRLSEICGEDLAESLIKAGQTGGALNLDMQLLINDGLEQMDGDQRDQVLNLLTELRQEVRQTKLES